MTINYKDWLLQAMKKYQGKRSSYNQEKIKDLSSRRSYQRYGRHKNQSVSFFPSLCRLRSRKKTRFCLVLALTQCSSSLLLKSPEI